MTMVYSQRAKVERNRDAAVTWYASKTLAQYTFLNVGAHTFLCIFYLEMSVYTFSILKSKFCFMACNYQSLWFETSQ